MYCPCGGSLIVKDARSIPEGYWRRRRCTTCLKEYTTVEQFCETIPGKRGRQAQIKVPKVPVIRSVKPRPPKQPKPVPAPAPIMAIPMEFLPKPSVRKKLEDLRMQKELQKNNTPGWD